MSRRFPARVSHPALILGLLLSVTAAAQDIELPPDWTAHSLNPCEDAATFSAFRTPDDPEFDFTAFELSTTAGARVEGQSLRWHAWPSLRSQTTARLTWLPVISHECDALGLWLKNPNAHDLELRLEIADLDGARYVSAPVQLAEETGWRQIVFRMKDLAPEGPKDPHAGIDFPLLSHLLTLRSLEHDRPHTVYIDEIRAFTAPRSSARLTELKAPTSLVAGERLRVSAGFEIADPLPATASIEAALHAQGGGPVCIEEMSLEGTNGELRAHATLDVPAWIAPGRYELRLSSSDLGLADARPQSIVIGGAPPADADASIDASVVPPQIIVGGHAIAPTVWELRDQPASALPHDAGVIAVPATVGLHPFGWAIGGEKAREALDRRLAAVLERAPDAQIIVQVFLDSDPAWDSAYQEQLVRFDGDITAPPQVFGRKRTCPDLVSPVWQNYALEGLQALLEHARSAAWRHRVVGYELLAGDVGEWRPWGAGMGLGDEQTSLRDGVFRSFVIDRYPDVESFRSAWLGQRRGAEITPGPNPPGFEVVDLPGPLPDMQEPSLYDPAEDSPMIDAQHFRALAPIDFIVRLASIVRDAAPGALVGASYGHFVQHSATVWRWPHLAVSELLEAGALDFLTGPLYRPTDASMALPPADSVRAAGALYLARASGRNEHPLARAAALASGVIAAAGAPGGGELLPRTADPEVDVLLVSDDLSARFLSGEDGLPEALLAGQQDELARSGLEWRHCLLRDVIEGRAPRAKLYLFTDTFTITPEGGRALARNACSDGAMLVWVYGPGAIDEELLTGRTMSYLTGLKLSLLLSRGPLRVTLDAAAALPGVSTQTWGLRSGSPRFFCADESVEWLGTVEGTEFCGFALKSFADCTSVFSAAPSLPAEVLCGLARRAGITPIADEAARSWFGHGTVILEGATAPRTLQFAEPVTVRDAITGDPIAEGARRMTIDIPEGDLRTLIISTE